MVYKTKTAKQTSTDWKKMVKNGQKPQFVDHKQSIFDQKWAKTAKTAKTRIGLDTKQPLNDSYQLN